MAIFLVFLISSFFLVAPKRIHSYDQARRFGGKAAILLKDYWKISSPQAYEQGRAVTQIFRNLRLANPYVTWEKYARPAVTNETRFIFTDQAGKAGYLDFDLADEQGGVYFFTKNDYLAELKEQEVPRAGDFLNDFFADLWKYQ